MVSKMGAWTLGDITWDHFNLNSRRFTHKYYFTLEVTESVRGSRPGEIVTRCKAETGPSSFCSALADPREEPVLKKISLRITGDEFAHYCMFHSYMRRYLNAESSLLLERIRVAFDRVAEKEDDELASAYWVASRPVEYFDRRSTSVTYTRATLKY